jgi:2-oxo-hept-3-ene-1,7-dioate hydratase
MRRFLVQIVGLVILWAGAFATPAAPKTNFPDIDYPDIDYMAQLMLEAQAAHHSYPDLTRINPELDDATLYAVQQRLVALGLAAGKTLGGFKGGLIPVAPVGGVLYQQGLLETSPRIDSAAYVNLLIEVEIAFEFCAPVRAPLVDIAALKAVVCKLRPAVELPDAAIHDLATLKSNPRALARALIANNMATKQVLLGAEHDVDAVDVDTLAVATMHNGKLIGARDLTKPHPSLWANVLWVVNEFVLKHDYQIAPGQIIIPGNLTGLHPGLPGSYRVDYGALGVVVFEVGP